MTNRRGGEVSNKPHNYKLSEAVERRSTTFSNKLTDYLEKSCTLIYSWQLLRTSLRCPRQKHEVFFALYMPKILTWSLKGVIGKTKWWAKYFTHDKSFYYPVPQTGKELASTQGSSLGRSLNCNAVGRRFDHGPAPTLRVLTCLRNECTTFALQAVKPGRGSEDPLKWRSPVH